MITVGLFSEDRTLHALLSSALGKDFQVSLHADSAESPFNACDGTDNVLILDLHCLRASLPDRLTAAQRLINSEIPTVILADDGLRSTAFELVRNGAFAYCRRPPSIRDLRTVLTRAFETNSLKRQVITAKQKVEEPRSCDQIIGVSKQMQKVYQLIRSVANLNAAVLVTGESGTGKELIARAVHNLGARADKPFVAVSCGAIPESLIEAELFGHEKGAFTGAAGAREGYFEQAADGTLLLDEIGDLSLLTQVKLLRVLQQMEFNRLGSTRLIPLRARLIFATHQNLAKLVAQGKFRQDLYYRINVMTIESPALQDRPEDIPHIASHFLRRYSLTFQKPMDSIEPDAIEALQTYHWPGNVRELENVMQRAIILASGRTVQLRDLKMHPDQEEPEETAEDVVNIGDYQSAASFEQQIQDYKVSLALSAVRENNGNKTLAARRLGISRAYLHRLIRLAEPETAAFHQGLHRMSIA